MAVKGAEALGTGLKDVMRLLLELPTERLLSLTYQLGGKPEERIVQALSLLLLHKETQGLDQLQKLQDNSLANHLAEKWHMAGGKLADFGEQCGHDNDNVAAAEGTRAHLARIFKVLFENRLCDPHLRDLAYLRAVSAFAENNNDSKVELMIDEAKGVCGPEFAEKMSLQTHLQSKGEADRESAASSLSQGKPDGSPCTPCPLLVSSSMTSSYPTHLEISLPPTAVFLSDPMKTLNSRHAPHPPDQLENHGPGSCGASHAPQTSSVLTSESVSNTSSMATSDASPPPQGEEPTAPPPPAPSKSPPAPPEGFTPKMVSPIQEEAGKDTREGEEEEEEEEETFYAFVILHASEDTEMAEAMRERLESVCGGGLTGATFSEDFAQPGRSSLRCIDDALENSAFTILLLTNHYRHSRRFQMEAESALINSIERRPKYNTVIPLLPRANGARDLPRALQTLVPLEEKRSFDKKVRRFLTAGSVRAQRALWSNEQQVKKELRRQERMKEAARQQKMLSNVRATTDRLRNTRLQADLEQELYLGSPSGDASQILGPGSNIHVNHANYVLIGNHSSMRVDLAGSNTDHVLEGEDN